MSTKGIKIYNGTLGLSQIVHQILEDKDGKETLCGIRVSDVNKTNHVITCKRCMTDAQLAAQQLKQERKR